MTYIHFKRLLDLFFLILISPLLIFLIVFISFMNKILYYNEDIFFIQKRIGKNSKPFELYKFRTMKSKGNTHNDWTQDNDTRITFFGQFLRKTRLDEIPQFYNILKNDMSLIGPRPEQVHLVQQLIDKYGNSFSKRHNVLPGITGFAQINYGYVGDFDAWRKKLDYDLHYVDNISFFLDIKIFVKTFIVLLKMYGSR